LESEAQQLLMSYAWPGNVRQLRNTIESAVALSQGPKVTVRDLPPDIRPASGAATVGMGNIVGFSIEQAERELIKNTLKLTDGNREQAAKILGIGERTLYRKIKDYDL
jgi:two-component system response regulator HydG